MIDTENKYEKYESYFRNRNWAANGKWSDGQTLDGNGENCCASEPESNPYRANNFKFPSIGRAKESE